MMISSDLGRKQGMGRGSDAPQSSANRQPVRMKRIRRIVWLALCAACLAIVPLKPDGGIIFIAPLIVLTFPAGLLGEMAFGALYEHFGARWGWGSGVTTLANWSYLAVIWSLVVACGYIQWFVFLPWVARRWDRLARK
jgi:hypothetical protein